MAHPAGMTPFSILQDVPYFYQLFLYSQRLEMEDQAVEENGGYF